MKDITKVVFNELYDLYSMSPSVNDHQLRVPEIAVIDNLNTGEVVEILIQLEDTRHKNGKVKRGMIIGGNTLQNKEKRTLELQKLVSEFKRDLL